jgi:hypothetical protein
MFGITITPIQGRSKRNIDVGWLYNGGWPKGTGKTRKALRRSVSKEDSKNCNFQG